MWANPYSKESKSPLDALKDFKKSLEEETSGEFKAEISIRIYENSRGFPLISACYQSGNYKPERHDKCHTGNRVLLHNTACCPIPSHYLPIFAKCQEL